MNKEKEFVIKVSYGDTTGIYGRYYILAKDELEAIHKAELKLEKVFGREAIQKVFNQKGLPAGYMSYYRFINLK